MAAEPAPGLATPTAMEEEERPSKMRKLDHEDHGGSSLGKSAAAPEPHIESELPEDREPLQETTAVTDTGRDGHRALEMDDRLDKAEKPQTDPGTDDDNDLPPPEDFAPLANSDEVVTDGPVMSKNQLKKLRKKQDWESKRGERKIVRKEKLIEKRERKRAVRQQQRTDNPVEDTPPLRKKQPFRRQVQLPVTILIDCDFDDLMRDNERISLASQITRCYSDNKNAMFRTHLGVCSFGGKLRERFDKVLEHHKGWRGVQFLDSDFVGAAEQAKEWMADAEDGGSLCGSFASLSNLDSEDALAKLKSESEVVYLSSEASETLTELRPYSTYIIGGLVDKNREKGICYKRATQRGIKTAKLPIGEYLQMTSRKVLATNHVNEIMLKWLESGDWGNALVKVIPKRKGGQLKDATADQDQEDQAIDDGDDDEVRADDHEPDAGPGTLDERPAAVPSALDAGDAVDGDTVQADSSE
ncbi:tRNA (guanine(9)-N(1))-methyltransferase [Friedmanniomyces endolithicus]|uniref:tRNA (guanine(9)-N1)-methyltransferase n=1 Tax=Friedmanniomyces endolithicus TaxID=329885 RepID=A0AAN6K6G6_9PEZI|nr:tRNA (guanine(9)-N(1))-methyltransferase [Friedmanniomyces endolithicus]KAK0774980.1 tRNA (guanine(9)-N(1))-methyltransferase [Friedmanniomyces endolithicus]KAK0775000.1 tRNA (guanine(9)-N(1))-methyltransferase [Friedmanniomyces endolithicus]KAK0781939.1 tRNA (guanine(9)-N(1))-methyltransferase [Friedmanniomyces endolithicus]KAK0831275.1 tRNA (guanine(9)-N(1))-methyltransferase [Friedmanniomyces endolithicus]